MDGDAFCSECGNQRVHVRVAPVTHKVGHRTVEIDEDRHLYCSDCGAIGYDGAMLDENQKAIARQIRKDEGLLSPDALRAVRLKYGLTQAEMEALLPTGAKTWVRWERGKVVQSHVARQNSQIPAEDDGSPPNLIRLMDTLQRGCGHKRHSES